MKKVYLILSLVFSCAYVYSQCNAVTGGTGNGLSAVAPAACNGTVDLNAPPSGHAQFNSNTINGVYTVSRVGGPVNDYLTIKSGTVGGSNITWGTQPVTFAANNGTIHVVVKNGSGCGATWNGSSATLRYRRERPTVSTATVTYNCTSGGQTVISATVTKVGSISATYQWQGSANNSTWVNLVSGTVASGALSGSNTSTSFTQSITIGTAQSPQYQYYRLSATYGGCTVNGGSVQVLPRNNYTGNVAISSNISMGGTYDINGDFTQSAGTITVLDGCEFYLTANNINIVGTISANGTGRAGGNGGGAQSGGSNLNCDVNAQAYTSGGIRGANSSGSGAGSAAASNGSNGVGCGQDCGSTDDYGGAVRGAGGAGGGGGGAYGGAGSAGGSGGTGGTWDWYMVSNNSYCGTPIGGGGGSAGGSAGGGHGVSNDLAIDFGAGGGGAGGGGRGASNGTAGAAGGRGGGKITIISRENLTSPYTFTFSGIINANGDNGSNGGNGGASGRTASNCCSDPCNQANVEEATNVTGGGGGGGGGGGSGGGVMFLIYGNSNLTGGAINARGGNGGSGGSGGSSSSSTYGGGFPCGDATYINNGAGGTGAAGGRGGGGRIKIFKYLCYTHSGAPTLSVAAGTSGNGTAGAGSTYNSWFPGHSALSAGTITGTQTICANTNIANITQSASTGGNGTYTYAWYYTTNLSATNPSGSGFGTPATPSGWTNASVATRDLDPPALTGSRKYVRLTVSGPCHVWSNVITITVEPQPIAPSGGTKLPNLANICLGTGVSLSGTTAGTGGIGCSDDYIWLINATPQGTYTLGSSVGTSAIAGQTVSIQGRRSGCTSGVGCTGTGYVTLASWTVNAQPVAPSGGTKSPNNISICVGSSASLSGTTVGSGGVGCSDDYIWLINGTPQGAYTLGTNVGSSATVGQVVSIQGRRSNCTSNAGCTGTSYTTLASWTVVAQPVAPVISKNPVDATVCVGANLTVNITSLGDYGAGTCNDRLRYSTNGGASWSSWSGIVPTVTPTASGTVIIQSIRDCDGPGCTSDTNSVSWTVNEDISIMQQPLSDGTCFNSNHVLSVVATGGITPLSYQWQESAVGCSSGWNNVGSNTPSHTTGLLTDVRYYRVIVSSNGGSGCQSEISNCATITILSNQSSSEWNGNVSTDWFNPDNWSNCVPGDNTVVTIPAGISHGRYPIIITNSPLDSSGGKAKAKKVNMATVGTPPPDADLQINTGAELKVNE